MRPYEFVKSRLEEKLVKPENEGEGKADLAPVLIRELCDSLDLTTMEREEILLTALRFLRQREVDDVSIWKIMSLLDGALNILAGLDSSRATVRQVTPVESGFLREDSAIDVANFLDLDESLVASDLNRGPRVVGRDVDRDPIVMAMRNMMRVRLEVLASWDELDVDYDNQKKDAAWRVPERVMIETVFGKNAPLRGKRMLVLETPRLLEWRMLEGLGGDERLLTVVERNRKKAKQLGALLPRAKVVHSDLEKWLVDIAKRRLLPRKDYLKEKRGLDLDGDLESINDVLFPPGKIAVGFDPRKLALAVQNYRGQFDPYSEWLIPMLQNPYFVDDGQMFFEPEESERFGLVSLDTKGLFDSYRYAISAMGTLGFWQPSTVVCTNFSAKRESEAAQARYNAAFVLEDRAAMGSHDWMETLGGTLDERRESISLDLVRSFSLGTAYREYSSREAQAPLCSILDRMLPELTVRDYADIFLHACNEVGVGVETGILADPDTPIRIFANAQAQKILFRRLVARVFAPLIGSMDRTARRKVARYREKSAEKFGGSGEDISMLSEEELFGRLLAALIQNYLDEAFAVKAHKSYIYVDGRSTRMFSDFAFLRKESLELAVGPGVLERMYQSLIEGRMNGRFDLSKVLDACFDVSRLENLRAGLMKTMKRVSV